MTTAVDKVRIELAKKRVRIEELFADFDKLRSGNVTTEQFKRCLATSISLHTLSEADFTALLYQFKSRDGLGVNYKAFMNVINSEEVPASALSPARTGRELSQDLELALAKMMDFFVHRITTTGLDVRQCFRDFDRHNCGKITTAQFERSFPFKVEPRFLHAIEEKYSDGQGNIMYLGWCNDVFSRIQDQKGPTNSKSYVETMASQQRSTRGDVDVDRVVSEIRSQMAAKRLRVDDSMKDYDKNHSGLITPSQFAAALGCLPMSRISLGDTELNALAARYAALDSTGVAKVQYGAFLSDIDFQSTVGVPKSPNENQLSPEEERQVSAILEKVRSAVRTRRVNLKPTFQDFDRAVKGIYQSRTCTKNRFQRALAINKISLAPSEIALLEKKYALRQADGSFEDDINYHSFCAAVDMSETLPETSMTGVATLKSAPKQERTLNDVLDKVMLQCLDRRIRLQEFLRDFDGLRSGSIPNAKFASALGIAGLALTQDDLDILINNFAHPTVAGAVNTVEFLKATDTGVVVNNQDSPTKAVKDNESALRQRLGTTESESAGDRAAQLEIILSRVSDTVRSKGILLPPFFHDYDKHHSGRITKVQFCQTLSRHRFPLSQSDVDLLCQVYADSVDPLQIRYRNFIGAVDETENVRKQHALRSTIRAEGSIPGTATLPKTNADAAEVMKKIAAFVTRRNARVDEFFHDHDPLRKGFVHHGKFRSALNMIGIILTEGEQDALVEKYKSTLSTDGVNYPALLKDLSNTSAATAANGFSNELPPFTGNLLNKIKASTNSRRLTTRQLFQDADKLRKGHVTEAQFFAALTSVNLKFAPVEADALRQYLKVDNGNMAYVKFCEYVDAPVI